MEYWQIVVLFISCIAGGISVFFLKSDNSKNLKLILSFSGAYLFGITVLHLIPDIYHQDDKFIGLFVLGGFLFQILLEQFSEGIEHGHMHHHKHGHEVFPLGIMLSLSLHAFLEGMPLAEGHQHELLWGIALHHIPAAFALCSLMLESGRKRATVIWVLVIFALMSPLGFIASNLIGNGTTGGISEYFDRIMAVVIGIFLHISTTILFESGVEHHFNRKKLIAVIGGMIIAVSSLFLH